jgi:hypothetical protein
MFGREHRFENAARIPSVPTSAAHRESPVGVGAGGGVAVGKEDVHEASAVMGAGRDVISGETRRAEEYGVDDQRANRFALAESGRN